MSDRELFAAIARGDTNALSIFYVQHVAGVRRIALRILRDEDDACDVAQEVFLKVHRAARAFRGDAHPHTVLHRIAVNESLLALRRHEREMIHRERFEIVVNATTAPDDPCREAERRRDRDNIHRAVCALSPPVRETLALALTGHSADEIARATNATIAAVKSRLHRGRLQLRTALRPGGFSIT